MRLNNNIAHYGDILAIPFFLITLVYFYNIENKTVLENLIMFFIFICLIGDIFFSAIYFNLL
jgi:hypothetical protein